MKVSDFYRAYYNNHYFRDVTFKMQTVSGDKVHDLKYNPDMDNVPPYEKFRRFLISPTHTGSNANLMAGISHYPNYLTWKAHNTADVLTDRLFIDLDYKTDESKWIIKKINNALYGILIVDGKEVKITGNERTKILKKYRKEYQQLIFKKDFLLPVYNEAMDFITALQDGLKLRPYLTFSGASGFHVNIFMPDQKLPYIKYVRTKLHNIFRDKLHLKYQDDKVLDAATRKQRVPYSKNPKSDLYVRPIPSDISYDEMLKVIKHNTYKVDDFCIENYYANNDFIDMLHYIDNRGKAVAIKEKEIAARTPTTSTYNGNKFYKGMININKPEEVMKLLSFQCFKNMEWSDYNNLLLVNLLWNTNLSTAEEVQQAMIIYWKSKGTVLNASASSLKRVAANKSGKYALTNNTMKRNQYCKECKDWKQCFRYKLFLSDEYKQRIHAYKEKHIAIS